MRVIYPCEESKTLMGDKVRRDYCRHNAGELIAGGTDAKLDEFPHMLSYVDRLCGDPDQRQIHPHSCNVHSNTTVYQIKRIIRHPDYTSYWNNNIALLETDSIHLSQSIVPACLDVFGGDRDRAVVTGWGWTTRGRDLADTLQKRPHPPTESSTTTDFVESETTKEDRMPYMPNNENSDDDFDNFSQSSSDEVYKSKNGKKLRKRRIVI
ncbi:hypothetical protein MSG28_014429 [Choristoneura fumiferana]|uniref:Uncharacterized protein n=1 Tax=Choristoneura fumiferana TaxID=7141 RepID=A0ACC0JRE1_CHOFU|nr:hypothetical protein MSG28_014429 [Choristoneura fumiferana]